MSEARPRKPLVKRIIYSLVIGLVCFSIIGFFILPPVLKWILVKNLSEKLHRTVAIAKVSVNPFVLSVDFEGIHISERGNDLRNMKDFVSCDRLHLKLEAVSVLKRGLIMREIRIVNPSIRISRDKETHYNFSDLLEKDKTQPSADSGRFRFSLNNIDIQNGSIDFKDDPKHMDHKVREINVRIPFLSNFPYYLDSYVKPSFEAKVNGRPVALAGVTKPFKDTLETSFNINLRDLDIPYYLAYLPVDLEFKIASALLTTKVVFAFVENKSGRPMITLSGNIDFTKVRITDRAGDFLTDLPAIRLAIKNADLASRSVHLVRLGIESPEVNLLKKKNGAMNVDVLKPKGTAAGGEAKPVEEPGVTLDIDEIRITGGKVMFTDLSTPIAFKTTVAPLEISFDHFSTVKEKKTAVAFLAKTESGEEVKVTGEMSVEPLTADGRAEVAHIPLKKYAPYYADRLLFSIEDAVLDLSGQYSFEKKEGTPVFVLRLTDIGAGLKNLKLRKKGEKEDFLKLPEFSVSGGSIDVGQREVILDKIVSRSGVIAVKHSADGTTNLLKLFAPQPEVLAPRTRGMRGSKAEKDWQYLVKSLRFDNFAVKYSDYFPADPIELNAGHIMIAAGRISNRKGSIGNASISLLTGKKGSLSAHGSLGINPLSSKMQLSLKNIELFPIQSYVTDRTNIIITDGAISAAGAVSVVLPVDGPMKAGYEGEVSVSSFRTVDSINTDELVSWNNLNISGIDASYNPAKCHISEIALTDFYARLIINPDASLNLQKVMRQQPAQAETPSGPPTSEYTAVPTVSREVGIKSAGIDTITLQGGTVQFSDYYIKPNYSARLVELGGRVSGLSSEENTMGDLDLRGKLDNYAPLEITGKINPLRDDLFVDLKAAVKDVDLSPVTPYSGRYAGYTIHKGKLSLDLHYHIEKKKLDADNRIFLDQLTFGDQVESPDATKLPVKLAVALLKNRKGEINLDLPVSGYINDPKFSVARIVLKLLLNLLVKAATSPFALLGAVFGGGEELSFIEFDVGSSAVSDQASGKLDTLIKALQDRPTLKLELEGHVDTERDREGLIRTTFMRKLKAQKLKDMVRKGEVVPTLDTLTIDPAEYSLYLKAAYKEEKFPKPRNIIGIAKDLPGPEMEKLMLAHVEISESDLRQLARERALKVEAYLLKANQIERERIFFIEPKTLQAEKKEKMKESRVDFRLK